MRVHYHLHCSSANRCSFGKLTIDHGVTKQKFQKEFVIARTCYKCSCGGNSTVYQVEDPRENFDSFTLIKPDGDPYTILADNTRWFPWWFDRDGKSHAGDAPTSEERIHVKSHAAAGPARVPTARKNTDPQQHVASSSTAHQTPTPPALQLDEDSRKKQEETRRKGAKKHSGIEIAINPQQQVATLSIQKRAKLTRVVGEEPRKKSEKTREETQFTHPPQKHISPAPTQPTASISNPQPRPKQSQASASNKSLKWKPIFNIAGMTTPKDPGDDPPDAYIARTTKEPRNYAPFLKDAGNFKSFYIKAATNKPNIRHPNPGSGCWGKYIEKYDKKDLSGRPSALHI
jgi:hypothetical protein